MPKKIGALLPYRCNDEMVARVKKNLDMKAELSVAGALDGLNDEQLRQLGEGVAPNSSYTDVLQDGTIIFLNRETVIAGMKRQAQKLLDEGCRAVLVWCSLPAPELDAIENVITPRTILENAALSVAPKASIVGVMQPIKRSMEYEIQHWMAWGKKHGLKVVSAFAAPQLHGGGEASNIEIVTEATRSLVEQGAELILLDCMAYTEEHRSLVARVSGKPVLRPTAMTASIIERSDC